MLMGQKKWREREGGERDPAQCWAHRSLPADQPTPAGWPVKFFLFPLSPKRRRFGGEVFFFFSAAGCWTGGEATGLEMYPLGKSRWASQRVLFFFPINMLTKFQKNSFLIIPLSKNCIVFLNIVLKKKDPKYCKYLSCIYLQCS